MLNGCKPMLNGCKPILNGCKPMLNGCEPILNGCVTMSLCKKIYLPFFLFFSLSSFSTMKNVYIDVSSLYFLFHATNKEVIIQTML
jgi:hypothetical protein